MVVIGWQGDINSAEGENPRSEALLSSWKRSIGKPGMADGRFKIFGSLPVETTEKI